VVLFEEKVEGNTQGEESTCLGYTGYLGELEHVKIETRLINEKFGV
jgi:hypothetical protein